MALASYKVYIDWNNDGVFTGQYEDVTTKVLDDRAPVELQYGRDQQRALSPIAPGEIRLALNNQSGIYSPENASSPLYDQVVPSRSVMVTATVGATTYTMQRAQIDDLTMMLDLQDQYLSVDCIDALGMLRGVTLSTGLYRGLRTGQAIGVILDMVGWPATARVLDLGATTLPFWWLDSDANAFDAIMDLVYAEGPPALFTVDSQNRFVFRSRHHRLTGTTSATSQSTWNSSGVEPLISPPADYNAGFKDIINSVSFDIPELAISNSVSVVWSLAEPQTLAVGQTLTFTAQSSAPFVNAIVPVAGVDYIAVSGSVVVTMTRTSGSSTTLLVTAAAGSAQISGLQLRAQSVTTVFTYRIISQDPSSIAKYGIKSLPDDRTPTRAYIGDAGAIATIIIGQRGERLPTIGVGMVSANTTRLTQQLTRSLSDRVHVADSRSGLNTDCFIEQISHRITQGGAEHRTTFGLEKCPSQVTGALVLGSATLGVLGTGKLGKRGLANASTMLILGTSLLGSGVLTA